MRLLGSFLSRGLEAIGLPPYRLTDAILQLVALWNTLTQWLERYFDEPVPPRRRPRFAMLGVEILEYRWQPSVIAAAEVGGVEFALDANGILTHRTVASTDFAQAIRYDVAALQASSDGSTVYALTRTGDLITNESAWLPVLSSIANFLNTSDGRTYALGKNGILHESDNGLPWTVSLEGVRSLALDESRTKLFAVGKDNLLRQQMDDQSWTVKLTHTKSLYQAGDYVYALRTNGQVFVGDPSQDDWKWRSALTTIAAVWVVKDGTEVFARTTYGNVYRSLATADNSAFRISLYGIIAFYTNGKEGTFGLSQGRTLYKLVGGGWRVSAYGVQGLSMAAGTTAYMGVAGGVLYSTNLLVSDGWHISLYNVRSLYQAAPGIMHAVTTDGSAFEADVRAGSTGWAIRLYHAGKEGGFVDREYLDLIRRTPSEFLRVFTLYEPILRKSLGSHFATLDRDGMLLAFANIVAYEHSAYRAFGDPAPRPSNAYNVKSLLNVRKLVCNEYCYLIVLLYRQAVPVSSSSPIRLHVLGCDHGAVGNHAQLFVTGTSMPLMLDPTIGLLAVATMSDVLNGKPIAPALIRDLTYRPENGYLRGVMDTFQYKVTTAIAGGRYKWADRIYLHDFTNLE